MDFSKLGNISKPNKPTNPIEIFEKLPNLPGTPNDIWRGQNEALQQWDKNRHLNDILIALNTGAGKTLAGLLIAQSLCNEGIDNILYICSTKDLVEQTSKEAHKVGIDHTTRLSATYSNPLFESGKSFCITTY
jgi:superfamily II DNA or RNA helicase